MKHSLFKILFFSLIYSSGSFLIEAQTNTKNPETIAKNVVEAMGGTAVEIDFSPMLEAANLLYYGPWVSERYVAVKEMIENDPDSFIDVTRGIIESGKSKSAEDYFNAEYKLKAFKRQSDILMQDIDFALTPTTGTIYTIDEVNEDPIQLNTNLGYYTNEKDSPIIGKVDGILVLDDKSYEGGADRRGDDTAVGF